jgi:hypothetical protein
MHARTHTHGHLRICARTHAHLACLTVCPFFFLLFTADGDTCAIPLHIPMSPPSARRQCTTTPTLVHATATPWHASPCLPERSNACLACPFACKLSHMPPLCTVTHRHPRGCGTMRAAGTRQRHARRQRASARRTAAVRRRHARWRRHGIWRRNATDEQ